MRKLTVFLFLLLLVSFVLEFSLNFRLSSIEGLSFKNISIYGLILLTLVGNVVSGRRIIASGPVTMPSIMFVVYCMISLFLTGLFEAVPRYSIAQELLIFKAAMDPYVLLVMFYSLLHDERTTKTLLHMLVGILIVFLLITLLGSFNIISVERVYINEHLGRTRGAFAEWNQFSLYVVTFMPLVTALMLAARSKPGKLFYAIVLMFCGYVVLLTGSRGGLVSLVAGVGAHYLLTSRKALGMKIVGAIGVYVVLLIGLIVLYYLLPENSAEGLLSKITGKFFETQNTETDYSSGRIGLWEAAWAGFLASPIYGTGWRTFIPLFGSNTHNDYLLYLVTTGVIGLYLFVLVFVRMIKTAFRHRVRDTANRHLYNAFIAGIAAYMMGSFLVNVFTPAYFVFIYAALILRLGFVAQQVRVPIEGSRKVVSPVLPRSRGAIRA